MKVLYASSEAYPFAMSGGLADVAGSLPKALRRRMVGCRVVMPLYSCIPDSLREKMVFIKSITVSVAWRRQYCGIFEAKENGITYYLLDNQYYFKRDGIYGFYDDAERFAFFARAVLDIIPHIDFVPDIIHCNDWQTGLTPVFLDLFYRDIDPYKNIKTLFTIHNIQYQGQYDGYLLGDVLGIPNESAGVVMYDNCVNYMKGGLQAANRITTVSPTYSREILDPWFGHGLDRILVDLKDKLSGILNGIDYDVYNPETDKNIAFNYNSDSLELKAKNKEELQKIMGLPQLSDVPVIGIVSRLVGHKGFDLVKRVFGEILESDVQVVILGSGEYEFESFFHDVAENHPRKVALRLAFDPALARKIYAGADIFLMPSKSEPCGLAQMISLRYGTIPIVRKTGGLNDTVFDSGDNIGNGFTFNDYNAHDLLNTVRRAVKGFKDRDGWNILVKRAMACENSWTKSASEYIKLYKDIIANG